MLETKYSDNLTAAETTIQTGLRPMIFVSFQIRQYRSLGHLYEAIGDLSQ